MGNQWNEFDKKRGEKCVSGTPFFLLFFEKCLRKGEVPRGNC